MTRNSLDDSLDQVIERFREDHTKSLYDHWAMQASAEELSDASVRQHAADALWVAEQFRDGPHPKASVDLAGRVVRAMHVPVASARRRGQQVRAFATAFAAVAAALLIAVIYLPSESSHDPAGFATAGSETPDVAVALRDGTAAYLQLAQSLASSVAEPTDSTVSVPVEDRLANASPVGLAVRGSAKTLQTAGDELRATVEPITTSALDAFGFLWKPAGAERTEPST